MASFQILPYDLMIYWLKPLAVVLTPFVTLPSFKHIKLHFNNAVSLS